MYELRVLNGFHRGATLPLDERTHVIGADDDADVVLVDPGVEAQHASLSMKDGLWSLSMLDGEVRNDQHNRPLDLQDLAPGAFARVGSVWVTVVEPSARWEAAPAEPVDVPEEDEALPADEEEAETGEDAYAAGGYDDEFDDAFGDEETSPAQQAADEDYPDFVNEEALDLDESATAAVNAKAGHVAEDEDFDEEEAPRRRRGIFFVPLAAAAILSAAAAYAMTTHSDVPGAVTKRGSLTTLEASGKILPAASLPDTPGVLGGAGSKHAAALASSKNLSPEALRQAFRQRLAQVDLLDRFNLDLTDDAWRLQASLTADESARFERTMKVFAKEYSLTVPVQADIGSQETMLPFAIRQVISGSNASIVTTDGQRLYPGDEYRGVRLVAIDGSHLKFSGKRDLDVIW